jgi:hypothetical protein
MIYKFVSWDVPPLENFTDTNMYKLHEKLENGEEPTREEKNRNLVFTSESPVYKFHGWLYDFREFLNEYWVETKYYGIMKVYAWDKTSIRKNGSTNWLGISKIVEA